MKQPVTEGAAQELFPEGPRAAENNVGLTVPNPHILWLVGEVIQDPCSGSDPPCAQQLVPQKDGLYGIDVTGKIQKLNSHSGPSLFQVREESVYEEDNCVIYPSCSGSIVGLTRGQRQTRTTLSMALL